MFKLFGKKRKYRDQTKTVTAIAQFLIDDTGSDLPTPFKEFINSGLLDYSLESLKHVDSYLEETRKKKGDLNDEQFTKIVLRCGAYCGEVIRKNSAKDFYWISYDDALLADPRLKTFLEKSLYSCFILFSEPQNFSFPFSKVGKYLENGPADSLYYFGVVVGELKGQ